MPADDLREAVAGLMGRAKGDLAELVAFKSVADPKQYPPEECEKAAQWVVDAFTEVGLQDVTASPTPDGSKAVHGHAPGPATARRRSCCTATTTCSRRSGEDAWTIARLGADRARRSLVRPRRGGLQGQHRHAPHRAARAQAGPRRASRATVKLICEGSEEQGTGGLEAFVPTNADLLRADTILVVDTGNFAVGVPTLTTTLRGMTSVDVTLRALGSAMHSGMFGGPAPDPVVGLIQMLASLHDEHGNTTVDGLDATQTLDRRRLLRPSSSAPTPTCSTACELMGDGSVADLLWARPSATVLGIDVPPVIGSSSAVQASAAARVSLRLPPGMTGKHAQDALVAHLRGARPVGAAVRDRTRRRRRPVRRLARRAPPSRR